MIYLFIKSLLISAAITYILYKWLQRYYINNVFYGDTYMLYRNLIRRVGDLNVFLMLFIPLAILIFYLLTRTYSSYFKQISEGIHNLANGNFSHEVIIHSNDEFSKIAQDLNDANWRLKQAIELEIVSQKSKDALIANLAHDLRTPLTSVIGYIDLLKESGNLSPTQVEEYTKIASNKAQYLEELVETLFDISKLDLSLDQLDETTIDIQELLLQLLDEMYPIFEDANFEVVPTLESHLNTLGNGHELARVFENLISNAVKYGDNSKPIFISAKKRASSLIICISNAGDKIADADIPHLFDMFYTVDRSRTFKGRQTGLGLYIAKTITEKYAGNITVRNENGYVNFEVTLPALEII